MIRDMLPALIASALAFAPLLAFAQEPTEERFLRELTVRLDPTARLDLRGFATEPKPRLGPRWLEHPELPLVKADVLPPEVPLPLSRPVRPRLAPEPAPLLHYAAEVQLPQAPQLPVGPLVRQSSPEVQTPPPLPILGSYVSDRVSLGDPSLEVSVATTRTPQAPTRATEVPFMPWNLPDPFENAQVVRLRPEWPENPQPPVFVVSPTSR